MQNIKIIYEEDGFLVIEKPAGIVVNRAESVVGETLQDWMENKVKSQKLKVKSKEEEEFINRSGVVHRLDKETSGLMVLAKNSTAFQNLKNQFKDRKTAKTYIALVHGKVSPKQGTINLPLARNVLNRMRFCVNVDGKMARTQYNVLRQLKSQKLKVKSVEKFSEENFDFYSLLEIKILTGRTHQIRVHFSHLGYPLVSDPIYLGKRLKEDLNWCPRVFLHAAKLSFFHPETNEKLEFESKLPEDLEKALGILSS